VGLWNRTTDPAGPAALEGYLAARQLRMPEGLPAVYKSDLPKRLDGVLLKPAGLGARDSLSIAGAEALIDASDWPLLPNLVPIAIVDEQSFACVLASSVDEDEALPGEGAVVRWHLKVAKDDHQAALLDTDCFAYVESVAQELEARDEGVRRVLEEIGPAYELQYLEIGKRARDFVLRPVRIACQNVVVALGAFAHDSSFDGLSVVAWQTCEVPHVAAHEANRALAALMLCDAFQSGGTMEIRFDGSARLRAEGTTPKSGQVVSIDKPYRGHPERRVPASLKRFARTLGVELDPNPDSARISPGQARELFKKITPMPSGLAERIEKAVSDGVATPERFCFTLLSQVWREIELDFLLAVSPRVGSIISGGAPYTSRPARQAESEVSRAALMVGMHYRRLDTKDGAGAEGAEARVLEDNRVGVRWEVLPEIGAVTFSCLASDPLPWVERSGGEARPADSVETLTVLPRLSIDSEAMELVRAIGRGGPVAVAVPHDATATAGDVAEFGGLLLRCPDRLAELDQAIESKLLQARISRA
jgi:hypothetical protein